MVMIVGTAFMSMVAVGAVFMAQSVLDENKKTLKRIEEAKNERD